jgi:hypothetical protein
MTRLLQRTSRGGRLDLGGVVPPSLAERPRAGEEAPADRQASGRRDRRASQGPRRRRPGGRSRPRGRDRGRRGRGRRGAAPARRGAERAESLGRPTGQRRAAARRRARRAGRRARGGQGAADPLPRPAPHLRHPDGRRWRAASHPAGVARAPRRKDDDGLRRLPGLRPGARAGRARLPWAYSWACSERKTDQHRATTHA